MASFKKHITDHWDIDGLASDIRQAEWYITEGPTSHGSARIDRMTNIGSYERIERMIKDLLPQKEVQEAEKDDTIFEMLNDATREYLDELAEQVGKHMKEHVYGTVEEDDMWLGQYEEGKLEDLARDFKIATEDLKRHGLGDADWPRRQGEYVQHGPTALPIAGEVVWRLVSEGWDPDTARYEVNNWARRGIESLTETPRKAIEKAVREIRGEWRKEMAGPELGQNAENMETREGRALLQQWLQAYLQQQGYTPAEAQAYVTSWVWDELVSWAANIKNPILKKIAKGLTEYRKSPAAMSGASMDGRGANDLAVEFVNGAVTGDAGSMYIHGDRIYSYGPHFPVAERHGGTVYVTSRQPPSKTTSTHVNAVKRAAEAEGFEVVEKNIPPEA